MFISPDPILAFRAERGTFRQLEQIQWKDNVKKIRELYIDHRFKQCASLCNDILETDQAHSLHKAFLHFYAAICLESLGLVAHNYSVNKLPFLDQAREHFSAALAVLPLPYCTAASGTYDCGHNSPQVPDVLANHALAYDPLTPIPSAQLQDPIIVYETKSDNDSEDGSYSSSVPDFDRYTCRNLDFGECHLPYGLSDSQHARLSQSLSSTHVLQEDLLPKPLFGNTKKVASLPLPPAPRALPPIPSRDPVLRKTALQTLLNPCVSAIFESSPITPRFNQIHKTFDLKFSQRTEEIHMRRYDAMLSSFRTQLLKQVAAIDTNISKTTQLQLERQRNKKNRLASFWSVKQEEVEVREKKERIERLKNAGWDVRKERHGWKGIEHYEELRARALNDVRC